MNVCEGDPALRDHLIALVETGTNDPAFHPRYRQNEFLQIPGRDRRRGRSGDVQEVAGHPPPRMSSSRMSFLRLDGNSPQGDGAGVSMSLRILTSWPVSRRRAAVSLSPPFRGGILSEQCGWCGRSLASFLDLDLTDPRLGIAATRGTLADSRCVLIVACNTTPVVKACLWMLMGEDGPAGAR